MNAYEQLRLIEHEAFAARRDSDAGDAVTTHRRVARVIELAMQLRRVMESTEKKPETGHEHIAQFFAYEHLPPVLQEVSKPFGELAATMLATLPRNPERTVALRKLLEAKDAAVRARLAR